MITLKTKFILNAIFVAFIFNSEVQASPENNSRHYLIDLEFGGSDFTIDSDFVVTDEGIGDEYNSDEEGISIYLSGGLQQGAWIYRGFFEVSTLPFVGDIFEGLIDPHKISEVGMSAGYEIPLSERFFVVPQLGFSHWSLAQDRYLVPEEEAEQREITTTGTNLVGKLDFVYKLNSRAALKYAFTTGAYEFGDKSAHRVGFSIAF